MSKLFYIVLTFVCMLSVSVDAQSIGVSFVAEDPSFSTLQPGDTAGVDAVAQSNWNNMEISSSDPNGVNSGTLNQVNDSEGKLVKGMNVNVTGDHINQVWAVASATWGFEGENLTLQMGRVHHSPTITVSEVPYDKYDIYVYIAAGENAGFAKASLSAAENAKGKVDDSTYFCKFAWLKGQFVRATAATLKDAQASTGGNYVVFEGNTANEFALNFVGKQKQGWLGVSAIQIVETK